MTQQYVYYNEKEATGVFTYRRNFFGKLILQSEFAVYEVCRPWNPYSTLPKTRTFKRHEYRDVTLADMLSAQTFKMIKAKQDD